MKALADNTMAKRYIRNRKNERLKHRQLYLELFRNVYLAALAERFPRSCSSFGIDELSDFSLTDFQEVLLTTERHLQGLKSSCSSSIYACIPICCFFAVISLMTESAEAQGTVYWLASSVRGVRRALRMETFTNESIDNAAKDRIEAGMFLLRESLQCLFPSVDTKNENLIIIDSRTMVSNISKILEQLRNGLQDREHDHRLFFPLDASQRIVEAVRLFSPDEALLLQSIHGKDVRDCARLVSLLRNQGVIVTAYNAEQNGSSAMPAAYHAAAAADVWIEIVRLAHAQMLSLELEESRNVLWRFCTGLEQAPPESSYNRLYVECLRPLLVCHNNSAIVRNEVDIKRVARGFVIRITHDGNIGGGYTDCNVPLFPRVPLCP